MTFGMRGSVGKCLPNRKCIEEVLHEIQLITGFISYIPVSYSFNTHFFECVFDFKFDFIIDLIDLQNVR